MEPLISIQFANDQSMFLPGDVLECDYQIDAISPEEAQAVEASVLWYTDGKGDEDMVVHFFERRVPSDAEHGNILSLYRFQTVLPNSPLSYDGQLVKINWCVRVRVFLRRGKEDFRDHPFQLGTLPVYGRSRRV